MTTTELIKLLKKCEFGASGRAREVSFMIGTVFHATPEITFYGSGDGCAGAELSLFFEAKKRKRKKSLS